VLARARAIAWSPASRAALDELAAIAARVAALAPGARLSLDLGLGRGFEYYTGVRFAAFAAGAADAVARGGRYDELVGRYGRATGAVGFAVDIEAIASAQRAAGLGPPEPGLGVLVVGADAPRIAAGLRGLGVRAAPHLGGAPTAAYAVETGWTHWLDLDGGPALFAVATGARAPIPPAAILAPETWAGATLAATFAAARPEAAGDPLAKG
jgi:ATP phosphoribosyltransferase regulatory subunit